MWKQSPTKTWIVECEICIHVITSKLRFHHIPLTESISWDLAHPDMHNVKRIYLQFAIDGVPPANSTTENCWLIACRIREPTVGRRLLLSGWQGTNKASVDKFLRRFVDEMNSLHRTGIRHPVTGEQVEVHLHSICADAPARAYIMNIKYPNGFSCCHKCWIAGERNNRLRMTMFKATRQRKRTHNEFCEQVDGDHHQGFTPLSELDDVDIPSVIPIDYMHSTCMGVVKDFLEMLSSNRDIVSDDEWATLDERIQECAAMLSREDFPRETRSLAAIAHYKAAELRQILLYIGNMCDEHAAY